MSGYHSRILDTIRMSVIGEGIAVDGPFGSRRVTYADYTASGRSLSFIEDFIHHEVMPMYANTHTEASGTGRQTTRFREDAREIILKACGGDERDCVIFCGSGVTGAIDKLIHVLNLRIPFDLDKRYDLAAKIPASERPVVFVGPYEHHSNEISWRETIADVVVIPENQDGLIDKEALARKLIEYRERPLRIGSFSAASNVTGIVSDIRGICEILHQHGALSFWDMAAGAPYLKIEMNSREPEQRPLAYMDACFISPHKFIGGPGTPGILVAKRELFKNTVPSVPGGGTVAYVNPQEHVYLNCPVHREEGGTPAIIESIRAGMVFQLKEAVGLQKISQLEESFIKRAIERWSTNPAIEILGRPNARRLSIVSFVIKHNNRYLHHNFVVSLLNDLFGIQSRGGCSCAGPYGHRLLGIDLSTSHAFEKVITLGCEGIKPGWTRINFNYFIEEEVFNYLVEAVNWVAENGWYLLPHYNVDLRTSMWNTLNLVAHEPTRLTNISYRNGSLQFRSRHHTEPLESLALYLEDANRIKAESIASYQTKNQIYKVPHEVVDGFETLRWFHQPWEVLAELGGHPLLVTESERGLYPFPGTEVVFDSRLGHYAGQVTKALEDGVAAEAIGGFMGNLRNLLRITDSEHELIFNHLVQKRGALVNA